MPKIVFAALISLTATVVSAQSPQPLGPAMIGRVAVNRAQIVFQYAGDLWSVDRNGGEARRLTTHPGDENFPAFSPDGSQLAFSRNVGGNLDVYVMPASGGEARRVTFHPRQDQVTGWTPDGKSVLLLSMRSAVPQLYKIQPDGSLPEELPIPEAEHGCYSPDGKRLAYSPNSAIGDWRYYRGGNNGRIFIADTADWTVEKLSGGTHNDEFPMWIGGRIYFISDRDGVYNLFYHDLKTKQIKQLTNFEKYGIRFASASPDAIVFVRDGRIHLHDIAGGQTRQVEIRLSAEAPEFAPRKANASRTIEWVIPGGNGDRIALGARGDVMIFDPATGAADNLTKTSGAAERWPTISPDGKQLAYFSDESGEYQLHVRSITGPASSTMGDGHVRKIAVEQKPSFYRELTWSPDSKKLAFAGKRLDLWIADLERGETTKADTSTYSYQEEWYPRWSPDGRWLVYSKHLKNRIRTIFIYDVTGRKTRQVSDGVTHAEAPVFDANGKYLYFASSPNAGMSEFGWGVLNGVLARPLVSRRLHAMVLQDGGQPPLLPNSGLNREAKITERLPEVRIDFDGLNRRVIDLPIPVRDYSALIAGRPGMFFALINEWPALPSPLGGSPQRVLYAIDFSKTKIQEKLVENIGGFEITADGAKLLYDKNNSWHLVSTDAAPKPDEGRLDFRKLEVEIDPRAEWRQIYHEAWRIMRDWFYDPNHHGLNLAELEKHYAEYLPSVTRREDLNQLIRRALGHVSVSHFGVGGGDTPQSAGPPARVALLGADYEIANNRYRFKRIYRAANYSDPVGPAQAPLDPVGGAGPAGVKEGEYLLAVDGQEVTAARSVYSYFENKGPGEIKITVGPSPSTDEGARTLSVYPTGNDSLLRLANHAAENRRRVEEASGGKLGYIYVANWGGNTIDAIRGLAGYSDRAGVIIDQRYNGGGTTPDYIIEWLKRKPLYYYTFREGDDIATPVNPGPAVKVLIAHEQNGSAAETFAFMYKLGKVGPIVGRRTAGAGIGPYVYTPGFIDGGRIQLPNRAAYQPDGLSWGVENVGVSPDYEVENLPQDLLKGRDAQLEKAIQVALDELKKTAPAPPKKPKYPIHK
ncbi:MAG TPA: S41 family peptidase [Blastocatellia bacterium]|jgi:tricorn protease|nr:S41 family peptidase [Blastocatellia bacterium]